MTVFSDQLRYHSLRMTRSRHQVFSVMKDATEPLTLMQIATLCDDIDRSSVYRTIDTFTRIGIVKMVPIGWKKRFELSDVFGPHHHHLRCVRCKSLHHVTDATIERAIESVAKRYGFELTSHQFELEGVCADCRDTDL